TQAGLNLATSHVDGAVEAHADGAIQDPDDAGGRPAEGKQSQAPLPPHQRSAGCSLCCSTPGSLLSTPRGGKLASRDGSCDDSRRDIHGQPLLTLRQSWLGARARWSAEREADVAADAVSG